MKLFLASAFNQVAELLPTKVGDLNGKNVIFIKNASDDVNEEIGDKNEDKWWIRIDREAFIKLGAKVENTDLRKITPLEFQKLIDDSDIIHFCGGSVFYLIDLIKKRGLFGLLVSAVRDDKIIYTGTSAGSMIVSSDLSVDKNDPEEKEIIKNISDFSGLGLIDFLIIPHADNSEFSEGNKKVIDDIAKYKTATFFLCDNQALWVDGDTMQLVLS